MNKISTLILLGLVHTTISTHLSNQDGKVVMQIAIDPCCDGCQCDDLAANGKRCDVGEDCKSGACCGVSRIECDDDGKNCIEEALTTCSVEGGDCLCFDECLEPVSSNP